MKKRLMAILMSQAAAAPLLRAAPIPLATTQQQPLPPKLMQLQAATRLP